MLEGALLFLIGIGTVLVSIASLIRLAWLAVLLLIVMAAAAAYGLIVLRRRPGRRGTPRPRREEALNRRMAA